MTYNIQDLETAWLIRCFELEIQRQFDRGIIKGTVHLAIGQEHIDVGVIARYDNPLVFGNHRSHGQYIAVTKDIVGCYNQILKNDTQHLYYLDRFLSTGIQGALCPVAVGNALAFKLKGIKRKVLCFVGDGTLGEGIFWESLGFAAREDLDISFVIIDNGYSMSKTRGRFNLKDIAKGFGIGYNNFADGIYKDGCSIIYAKCDRLCGHSCNDTQTYRPKDENLTDYLIDEKFKEEAERVVSQLIRR